VPGTERCFRRPLALGVAVVVGGCAAWPSFVSVTKTMTAPRIAASAPSSVVVSAPLGRRSIGEPEHETLPFELLPMAGGRSLLAVSQTADDLRVWARRIDGATGAQGELLALEGERIAAAFDAPDGGTTIVTTQGASVCIALLAAGATSVASRSCASITPVAVARIGGRLAAIELDDSSGNTRRGPVDARVRWVSPGGSFETTSVDAGLHFDRPLAGMTVADTASRGDLLDVLFFESVPGVRPKGKLGRARLAIATLGGDGKIVARSRHVLAAGELEFGHIAGRRAPQLVTDDATTALVTLESRDGPCRVMRAAPKVGVDATMDSACAIDPIALALETPPATTHALEAVYAADPRRAPLQTRADVPLVTWAGGRAYFASSGDLRSADRATGEIRTEPSPFPALRTKLAGGAFVPDGEGLALVGGSVVHVAPNGDTTTTPLANLAPAIVEEVRAPSDSTSGRAQIARIGDSWWIARRDVVRVWPTAIVARDIRAFEGATALAGGETRGMFLELAGGALSVRGVTPTGEIVALPNAAIAPSPVGFGFQARARDGGGAIVTGPSTADRGVTVELSIDAEGHAIGARSVDERGAESDHVVCRDGTVRSFETRTSGLDTRVEIDIDRAVTPTPPPSSLAASRPTASTTRDPARAACSPDMVSVAGTLCIDRFEATLVDVKSGGRLSPDYPVTPSFLATSLADWATGREHWGDVFARATPLPTLPAWELVGAYQPMAVSRPGARPNAYVQGLVARAACVAAGKRLCTAAEFRTACRGEADQKYPYGPDYVAGACNVERDDHPALVLHANASFGHLDPRLDRVVGKDGPLVHETGATPRCASAWGPDAAYDMVGNLDEWVDDGAGAFAGAFFARQTREGCDAVIHAHPYEYLDYSTGVRCCEDAVR